MLHPSHSDPVRAPVVDIVWDGDLRGTALASSGRRLRVGADGDWPPEALVALAYGTSVMETFIALAAQARLDVLAYVSAVTLDPRHGGHPAVVLAPCVMVGTASGVATAERLLEHAAREAPLAAWLTAPVEVRAHVHPPAPLGPHQHATPAPDLPAAPTPRRTIPGPRHGRER